MGSNCTLLTSRRREKRLLQTGKNVLAPLAWQKSVNFCVLTSPFVSCCVISQHINAGVGGAKCLEGALLLWVNVIQDMNPISVSIDRGLILVISGHAGEGSACPACMHRGRAYVSCETAEPIGVPPINYSVGHPNVSRSRPEGQYAEVA